MNSQIQAIKERLKNATPGKWAWRMNPKQKNLMLISNASMTPIVMEFWRWGMHSAIAVFRDFKDDILKKADKWSIRRELHHDYNFDIIHPDAQFIANAKSDIEYLLEDREIAKSVIYDLLYSFNQYINNSGISPSEKNKRHIKAAESYLGN